MNSNQIEMICAECVLYIGCGCAERRNLQKCEVTENETSQLYEQTDY